MSSKKGDYEIGYGKPPEHSRFQKGWSANPAGRPKGKTAPSPITTRAVKENRRPPLTTLATRLMLITRDSRRASASMPT